MSTWQLGVKHSITKRCTRGPCREVRLVAVANPRRVRAPSVPLSVQVERGLGGRSTKGWAITRSWLKRNAGVRANRSVDRLVPRTVTPATTGSRAARATLAAPVPAPFPRPAPAAGPGAVLPCRPRCCGARCRADDRSASRCCSRRTAAPRSDRRSSTRQAPVTAARPRAVPVAPASEVPYQKRTTGTRTQLKAAQRTRSLTVSVAGAGAGRGAACAPGCTAGCDPDGGAAGRDPDGGTAEEEDGADGRGAVSGPGTFCSLVLLLFSMLSMAVAAQGSTPGRPAGHCPGARLRRPAGWHTTRAPARTVRKAPVPG